MCCQLIGDTGLPVRVVVIGSQLATPRAFAEFSSASMAGIVKAALDGRDVESGLTTPLKMWVEFSRTRWKSWNREGEMTGEEVEGIHLKLEQTEMALDTAHRQIAELQGQLAAATELCKIREEEAELSLIHI